MLKSLLRKKSALSVSFTTPLYISICYYSDIVECDPEVQICSIKVFDLKFWVNGSNPAFVSFFCFIVCLLFSFLIRSNGQFLITLSPLPVILRRSVRLNAIAKDHTMHQDPVV